MTRRASDTGREPQPETTQAQLPWYVNDTLSEAERAQVEQHLAQLPDLQADLEQWRLIAAAARSAEAREPAPSAARFAALMAQIEAHEAATSHHRRGVLGDMLVRFWASFWRDTPIAMRLAVAVQSVLIVALTGALAWQAWLPPDRTYRTLSSPEAPRSSPRSRVRLIWTDEATMQDVRDQLAATRGSIIAGPSPLGVYTIEFPFVAEASTALLAIVKELRAHDTVRLVEPVPVP